MKKWLIIFLLFAARLSAQKIPDYGFNKVRIVTNDKVIQAETIPVSSDPSLDNGKTYYWSSSNAIHATQGGFSGKLLNGAYTEFYSNKNIREQGHFNKGLKTGIWKSWNESGTLIQLYTWKDGVISGKFEVFQEKGKLKQSGTYKNNLLHGKITNYSPSGEKQQVMYKSGKPVTAQKRSFLKRLKLGRQVKRDSTKLKP